jgi:hypothetical protein
MSAALVAADAAVAEHRYVRRVTRLQRLGALLGVASVLIALALLAVSGAAIYRFGMTLSP